MHTRHTSPGETMKKIFAVYKKTRKLADWKSEAPYEKVLRCYKAWQSADNRRSCDCRILRRLPGLVAAKDLLVRRFAFPVRKFARFLVDGGDFLHSLAK